MNREYLVFVWILFVWENLRVMVRTCKVDIFCTVDKMGIFASRNQKCFVLVANLIFQVPIVMGYGFQ